MSCRFMDAEKKEYTRFIDTEDKDEEYVLKSFLMQAYREFNPLKYGITSTSEAVDHYLYTINSYATMINFYGVNNNINQYNIVPEISDMEFFMEIHMDKRTIIMLHDILSKTATQGWDQLFKYLLKDKIKHKSNLLQNRDYRKKMYYNNIQKTKPGWFTEVPNYNYWKAMIAFSEKNDRRFQQQKKKE